MSVDPVNRALSARSPVVLGVVCLVLLLVVLVGWGALTAISGAVIARGRAGVARNRQVGQRPGGGVIA